MKITKLIQAHWDMIPGHIQEYIDMANAPIDHAKAKSAINELYAMCGKKPPLILYFDNPIHCKIIEKIFSSDQLRGQLGDQLHDQLDGQLYGQLRVQLGDQLDGQLRDQLDGQLGDQLHDQLDGQLRGQLYDQLRVQLGGQLGDQLDGQLGGQLRDQLYDQLRVQLRGQLYDQLRVQLGGQLDGQLRVQLGGQLRDQLGDQLGGQLGGQLRDQLYDQLRVQLGDQLGGQLGGQLRDQLGGQLKYYWLNIWWLYLAGWYSYMEKIGIQLDLKALNLFRSYCENTFFCIPYENIYIYSEKPIKIVWDENKRLHNETGSSVEFAGGYHLWSWHGVTVNEKIIMRPGEITVEEIQKENNAERRRIMLERFGPSKFFMETGAKIIDADYLNLIGSSMRALIEDKFGERWLIASDGSTSRVYNLPMDRGVKSCREAHKRICGFSEKHLIAEA